MRVTKAEKTNPQSTVINSKDNHLLLLSIEDISQMSSLLNSFYLHTDSLYKKTGNLLNSFHVLLELFCEGSSRTLSSDTHKSSLFLSEYAKMNALNNACSSDLISVEALKQENKQVMTQLRNYCQLNSELYQEYKNNSTRLKGSNGLIEMVKQIAVSNQSIKECLALNHSVKEGVKNEKMRLLVEKMNDLKEKNEVLTLELFKRHSQSKLQLVLTKTKDEKCKEGDYTQAQEELNRLIRQIDELKQANASLTYQLISKSNLIDSFLSEIDSFSKEIGSTISLSNEKLHSLSKQYDADLKYAYNSLLREHRPIKDESSNQFRIQSRQIDFSLSFSHLPVLNDISMQLVNIIQGTYAISSERKQENCSLSRYAPVIKEINSKIESIGLLVNYQSKKITSQSKVIDYLSCESNIESTRQYTSHTNNHSKKHHSHLHTQPTPTKEKEIRISFLFNHFNHLHKDKEVKTAKSKGDRIHRHNSLTSLRGSNLSSSDSRSDLFKATEKKLQDKIKEVRSYNCSNNNENKHSACNDSSYLVNKNNTNYDSAAHMNNNTNSDSNNTKANTNNNFITINDLKSDYLISTIQNKKNPNFYRNNLNLTNLSDKSHSECRISSKPKRLIKCSSMKSIKNKDLSNSVYTPYHLSKVPLS